MLQRSENFRLLPGAFSIAHLQENIMAVQPDSRCSSAQTCASPADDHSGKRRLWAGHDALPLAQGAGSEAGVAICCPHYQDACPIPCIPQRS
jgi:hypothetical protein